MSKESRYKSGDLVYVQDCFKYAKIIKCSYNTKFRTFFYLVRVLGCKDKRCKYRGDCKTFEITNLKILRKVKDKEILDKIMVELL